MKEKPKSCSCTVARYRKHVIALETINAARKVIAMVIAEACDYDTGKGCYRSKARLMLEAGISSRKSFDAAMRDLIALGLVERLDVSEIEPGERPSSCYKKRGYIYNVKIPTGHDPTPSDVTPSDVTGYDPTPSDVTPAKGVRSYPHKGYDPTPTRGTILPPTNPTTYPDNQSNLTTRETPPPRPAREVSTHARARGGGGDRKSIQDKYFDLDTDTLAYLERSGITPEHFEPDSPHDRIMRYTALRGYERGYRFTGSQLTRIADAMLIEFRLLTPEGEPGRAVEYIGHTVRRLHASGKSEQIATIALCADVSAWEQKQGVHHG